MQRSIELLKAQPVIGYGAAYAGSHAMPAATEPTALAALTLAAYHAPAPAAEACDWLASCQQPSGLIGISREHAAPCWPTALAIAAWSRLQDVYPRRWLAPLQRAVDAMLRLEGEKVAPTPDLGHDTQLVAWPWVAGTHSWVEPTALTVLGLKAAGYREHPRVREAVTLLRDRQIDGGAWNCGNTVVLGQTQANHVQPTGIALLALADEDDWQRRGESAIRYLLRELHLGTGTSSLCWAWMALAAHDRCPDSLENEIRVTARYVLSRDRSPHKLALLALAALGNVSPLHTHVAHLPEPLSV